MTGWSQGQVTLLIHFDDSAVDHDLEWRYVQGLTGFILIHFERG